MTFSLDSIVDRQGLSLVPDLFRVSPADAPHQARGKRLLLTLLVVAAVGGVALLVALVKGHHVMGTSSELPWGVLIATYVFFGVSSTGLCLVSSLGHVFGFAVFKPIAKKAVFLAFVTLLVGFTVIGVELERPFLLMKYAVLSPNFSSPIWWMGTVYGVYTTVVGAELYFLFTDDHHKARIAGIASVVLAIAAYSNLGAVFGLSHSRPYWYGPLLPVSFIATALLSGVAMLTLVVTVGDSFSQQRALRPEHEPLVMALRQLLALFLGLAVFITTWRLITGVSGGHAHKAEVTLASLTGPLFVSFWLFEVFLGLAVPLWLVLGPKRRAPSWVALAAGLTMLGSFVGRYNFVYAGQMFSLKPLAGRLGETLSYEPGFKGNVAGFLAYTPSVVEVLIVLGAVSIATVVFVGGLRALRLSQEPAHG